MDPVKLTADTFPLHVLNGHIFVELEGGLWVLDTGAPTSFGSSSSLSIVSERFSLGTDYLGLTAATLSQFVDVPCAGLLGADILGRFDHLLDTAGGTLSVSTTELSHTGQMLQLDSFMGIPIVIARVGSTDYRMFFDTGAQISYFQDDSIANFPAAGTLTDFYPGIGQFQSDTHEVPVTLGRIQFTLRCGTLPGLLGMSLLLADTQGIVGNAILKDRIVAYFPRRRILGL